MPLFYVHILLLLLHVEGIGGLSHGHMGAIRILMIWNFCMRYFSPSAITRKRPVNSSDVHIPVLFSMSRMFEPRHTCLGGPLRLRAVPSYQVACMLAWSHHYLTHLHVNVT
jgi:hypothetical protein